MEGVEGGEGVIVVLFLLGQMRGKREVQKRYLMEVEVWM